MQGSLPAPQPEPTLTGSGAIEIEPWNDELKSGPRAVAASPNDLFGKNLFESDADDELAIGIAGLELAGAPRTDQATGPDWPSGVGPERGTLAIDPVQLRTTAGFPPAPSSFFLAPHYAWQVLVRRRALRENLARLERELATAERQRDELLGRMVSEVRPQLEAEPRLMELLVTARQLGALTGERGQALEAINSQYRAALADADARRGGVEARLGEHQAALRARAVELALEDENFRRAEARHKRVQIEIRSAVAVAQNTAQAAGLPPGTARPEDAARIESLQKQASELEHEVVKVKNACDAARSVHDAAARAVAESERELERLGVQQRALDRDFGKQVDVNAAGLSEAENQLRTALADAGRRVLGLRGGVVVTAATLASIAAADAEVARLCAESELHLRAIDACDVAAVQRGYTVAALGTSAIVLVLVALVLRAC